MSGPLKNLLLQGFSIGLRYWFQLLLFRKLNFSDIGELNIYLVFITFSTIMAGLEFHYLANRELVLSENRTIDALGFRLSSAFFITLVASLVYFHLNEVGDYLSSVIMLLAVSLVEYVNLELSRIQIACGRYISASLFGTFRAIGPYIAFAVPNPNVGDCLISLLMVSLASALIQYHIVTTSSGIKFRLGGFDSAKFSGLLPFFLTGALTAGGAFFERYAIKENISADELGRYAVVFVFVTLNDTLINGLFLQPYYSRIIADLSASGKRFGMLVKMHFAAISSIVIIIIFSVTFGRHLYEFLKKKSLLQ